MAEKEIGKITHYFGKIGVAVIELSDTLKVGDTIHVRGANADFEQNVDSMEVDKNKIEEAKSGDAIGMKVKEHANAGCIVYKVEE